MGTPSITVECTGAREIERVQREDLVEVEWRSGPTYKGVKKE